MKDAPEDQRIMPTAWLLIWTIYMVKFVMIFAIFWSANSFEPTALVAATTWFWLGPAIALAASPAAFRIRLHRMRRRRARLLRSEWMVSEPDGDPISR